MNAPPPPTSPAIPRNLSRSERRVLAYVQAVVEDAGLPLNVDETAAILRLDPETVRRALLALTSRKLFSQSIVP